VHIPERLCDGYSLRLSADNSGRAYVKMKVKWYGELLSFSKKRRLRVMQELVVRHHTKDKGDEGLGQVIAKLMSCGVWVAVPLSEHLPFDLIAIGEDGAMRRLQVRYRASVNAAQVRCHLGGSWADRNGTHKRVFDSSARDVLASYCPSPKTFVYLRVEELPPNRVSVRLAKPRNNQVKSTRDASGYRNPWRMFAPSPDRGEQVSATARVADATPS
jgi:hypothetical protein